MSIASRERKGSPLKALARNALLLKLEGQEQVKFAPKDERFYDAYASLTLWAAVRIAQYEPIKFYLENGYDMATTIYEGRTKYNTLKELAEFAKNRYDGKPFNKNIEKIIQYLGKKVVITNGARPIFNIIPEELNKKDQIDAQYISGDYVCKFVQSNKSLKILELFESGFDYGV
ncbi:MAG TPA: hypothetical protein VNF06_03545 [Candidatus Aquilonibacter sp.]|nr:hypothetical protein [Candidatus Aquilonibacter sp.]